MAPRTQKAAALAMFNTASAAPETADWRAIAEQLAAMLTTGAKRTSAADDGFAPWSDKRPAGKGHPFHVIRITFADGETVETSLQVPANGRPADIAKSCRVASDFYRSRMRRTVDAQDSGDHLSTIAAKKWCGHVAVPEIASVVDMNTGAVWNPETASRETAEHRAGAWSMRAVIHEANEAGLTAEEAADWLRVTFEEEARADLLRHGMLYVPGSPGAERIALHNAGGLRQVFPGDHPHGGGRPDHEPEPVVIHFRRPVAARTFARALASAAFPDAIGARPFAA